MSDHMTRYKVSALITHLTDRGFELDADAITKRAQELNTQERIPLYINILVGFGTAVSSLLLLIFLAFSRLINFKSSLNMMVVGILLLGGGVMLYLNRDRAAQDLQQTFSLQFSFVLANLGKALMVVAVGMSIDSIWGVTLALMVITALTYRVYQVSIDRFLSPLACFILLSGCILKSNSYPFNVNILFFVFVGAQLLAVKHLWMDGKLKSEYRPLGYAIISSLCFNVLYLASITHIRHYGAREELLVIPITLALAGALIGLIIWAAGGIQQLKTSAPLLLGVCGVVCLGLFSAPGVLLSLALMILGYATHERLITSVGIFLLPLVIFHFYYNVDTSLMKKSLILIGTGVILLIGRIYLKIHMSRQEAQLKLQEVAK